MVDPGRNPLSGLVEVDETTINHRTRNDPPADSPHAFIGIGMRAKPITYKMLIPPEATG